ncbi:MAG: GDP-L-fucose synthase [bacterium]
MEREEKIYIAGHKGLIGQAILLKLKNKGYTNIVTKTSQELDLTRQSEVERFFQEERPEYVFLAAARVGGINANMRFPAKFIYENLLIQSNIIHSAYLYKVKKLLFFGCACCYPCEYQKPIKEENLLSGYLEPTNEAFAVAKIAGIKMCEAYNQEYNTNFISAIPTNAYGPNDNFDLDDSHVIPALIKKFHNAKIKGENNVVLWGTGKPIREFIYVDDLADASIFLMEGYNKSDIINIGTQEGVSIKELAYLIKEIVNFKGEIIFDIEKPDGMAYKVLDGTRLRNLGWQAKISLKEGLFKTYNWYLKQ